MTSFEPHYSGIYDEWSFIWDSVISTVCVQFYLILVIYEGYAFFRSAISDK